MNRDAMLCAERGFQPTRPTQHHRGQWAAGGLTDGLGATSEVVVTSTLVVVLAAAATAAALWRGRHGFGAPAFASAAFALLITPLYALFVLADPMHAATTRVGDIWISPWGTRCLVIAALVGAVVTGAFTAALRRAVPVATHSRAAAIGACAGAWAGVAVFVFCPSGDPQHLLAGHVMPIVVLTVLGAMIAPRWLRP